MVNEYKDHLQKLTAWLEQQNNIDVLYVSYNDIIKDPDKN
jgi:hypothetical protein